MKLKRKLLAVSAGATLVVVGLAVLAQPAAARMVCNSTGDCWHTETNYSYPGTGYTNHNDDWYFHQTWNDQRHYRDYHEGRGYYKSGIWLSF